MQSKPFSNSPNTLKVLDVGTMLAGPFAATIFGDFGADVIKAELPGKGERVRGGDGLSTRVLMASRNKRSVTLDLRVPEGQAIVRELAQWADVLVENFRPGTMAKWNLGYEDLAKINPRLVYVSASAYGQTGPLSRQVGYDSIGAGFGGLTYRTGFADRPPVLPGMAVSDFMTALYCAIGALEALRRRDGPGGSGKGEWVDCALYEPFIHVAEDSFIKYSQNETIPQRIGSLPLPGEAPERIHGYCYKSSDDKYISTVAVSDREFASLKALIGDPALDAPDLQRSDDRVPNYSRVDAAIRSWAASLTAQDMLAKLAEASIPVAPINNVADIVAHPHVAERENLVRVTDTRGREFLMQNVVPRLVNQPGKVRWPGEELGASNEDVYLGLLKMDRERFDDLKARGVI